MFSLLVSALFLGKLFCPTWPDAEVPAHRLRVCYSQHKKPVYLQAAKPWWHIAYRAHYPACSFPWWLKKILLTSGHCTLAALLYCRQKKWLTHTIAVVAVYAGRSCTSSLHMFCLASCCSLIWWSQLVSQSLQSNWHLSCCIIIAYFASHDMESASSRCTCGKLWNRTPSANS